MNDKQKVELITKALRDLAGEIYRDCHRAYGAEHYEGQFEREI